MLFYVKDDDAIVPSLPSLKVYIDKIPSNNLHTLVCYIININLCTLVILGISAHRRVDSFPSPIPELIVEEEDNESDTIEGGGDRRPSSVDITSLEYENLSIPHDTDVFLSLSQNYSIGNNDISLE